MMFRVNLHIECIDYTQSMTNRFDDVKQNESTQDSPTMLRTRYVNSSIALWYFDMYVNAFISFAKNRFKPIELASLVHQLKRCSYSYCCRRRLSCFLIETSSRTKPRRPTSRTSHSSKATRTRPSTRGTPETEKWSSSTGASSMVAAKTSWESGTCSTTSACTNDSGRTSASFERRASRKGATCASTCSNTTCRAWAREESTSEATASQASRRDTTTE